MNQKTKSSKTSKGERRSIAKDVCKAVKRERTVLDKNKFKLAAWEKGQNPWITVPNENTNETNKRFIRVRANEAWGDPRKVYMMYGSKD